LQDVSEDPKGITQLKTGHLIECKKKMKNYAGIFRYIMPKNMLIMQNTLDYAES